jgi:hypothetical protein
MFWNGSTAIEGLSGSPSPGEGFFGSDGFASDVGLGAAATSTCSE